MKKLEQQLRDFFASPSQESFEKLAQWILPLMLVVEKMSPEMMGQYLNFKHWLRIYEADTPFDKWKPVAFQKMTELAKSFNEWIAVHHRSSGELREQALRKMVPLAKSFEEWEHVYRYSPEELREQAFQEMTKLAKSFEEWTIVCEHSRGTLYYSPCDTIGAMRIPALRRAIKLAKDFREWEYVYDLSPDEFKPLVVRIMKRKFLKSFEECKNFYKNSFSEIKFHIFQRMTELAKNDDEWIFVYGLPFGTAKDLAFQKITELAKSFSEWDTIYSKSPIELQRLALQKMTELAKSFNEWAAVHRRSSGEQKKYALQNMAKLAESFDEWETIYNSSYGGDKLRKQAYQKMLEALNK